MKNELCLNVNFRGGVFWKYMLIFVLEYTELLNRFKTNMKQRLTNTCMLTFCHILTRQGRFLKNRCKYLDGIMSNTLSVY